MLKNFIREGTKWASCHTPSLFSEAFHACTSSVLEEIMCSTYTSTVVNGSTTIPLWPRFIELISMSKNNHPYIIMLVRPKPNSTRPITKICDGFEVFELFGTFHLFIEKYLLFLGSLTDFMNRMQTFPNLYHCVCKLFLDIP